MEIVNKLKAGMIIAGMQRDYLQFYNNILPILETGEEYVNEIKRIYFENAAYFKTALLQDFHPSNHISFASNHNKKIFSSVKLNDGRQQLLWPDHCVQGTAGADLILPTKYAKVIKKGENPRTDSYSGFKDDLGELTGLHEYLRGKNPIVIFGVPFEFCIRFTIRDAINFGFDPILVTNLCRGLSQESITMTIDELVKEYPQITIVENFSDIPFIN